MNLNKTHRDERFLRPIVLDERAKTAEFACELAASVAESRNDPFPYERTRYVFENERIVATKTITQYNRNFCKIHDTFERKK